MKKLIALILLAGVATLSASGAASADLNGYNPTCGQNAGNYASAQNIAHIGYSPEHFVVWWNQKCGLSGTVLIELQRNEAGTWHDVVAGGQPAEYLATTDKDHAGIAYTDLHSFYVGCGSGQYRGKVYDDGGPTLTQTINPAECS